MNLVPDRECGDCTACCHHIPINQADMVKLPNIDCEHLMQGGGCHIYKSRPDTCAQWYCAWRYMPFLGEQWRPDKMGALMDLSKKGIPDDFPAEMCLVIKVIDKEKALSNDEFSRFIAEQIDRGTAIILSYGLDLGFSAATVFLNEVLKPAVSAKNKSAVKKELHIAIKVCENLPKNILTIKNGRIVSQAPK